MANRLLFLVMLLFALSGRAEDFAALPPTTLVKQVIENVLSIVRQDREITHDLTRMDKMVDGKIIPYFDLPLMTRLTIGNSYWTKATILDQQQLIGEYRTFLTHAFSAVIAQYTNQTIFYYPQHLRPGDGKITVRTTIIDTKDEPTELDFRMEKTATGWKVYDIGIDNISLIRIYHSNFRGILLKGGVDNLIQALDKKNRQVIAARHG